MKYLSEAKGKNGISAKVVCASVSSVGKKLTTLELRYPRFIHSEFMTHRLFSRNAASSRAIPVSKVIDQVVNNPVIPVHFGLNQSGMQASDDQVELSESLEWWLEASRNAVWSAEDAIKLNLHKQISNRILEPWQFITTLVSATEWDNFFAQRISPAAQPEIQELAKCMKQAMNEAEYRKVGWHMPYITYKERTTMSDINARKLSVARCCRVSYNNQGSDKFSIDDDIKRYDSLLEAGHWSPFEHVAQSLSSEKIRSGNFNGWMQYRNIVQVVKCFYPVDLDYLDYV